MISTTGLVEDRVRRQEEEGKDCSKEYEAQSWMDVIANGVEHFVLVCSIMERDRNPS
jgi:hypothetical protein